jgi:hypothetical protein
MHPRYIVLPPTAPPAVDEKPFSETTLLAKLHEILDVR